MTYTRKPREDRTVTFKVSWIEEWITLYPFGDMSREAMTGIANHYHEPLLLGLPADLKNLIEDCSVDEFNEFIEEWGKASRDREAEAKAMQEQFQGITKMVLEGMKKKPQAD